MTATATASPAAATDIALRRDSRLRAGPGVGCLCQLRPSGGALDCDRPVSAGRGTAFAGRACGFRLRSRCGDCGAAGQPSPAMAADAGSADRSLRHSARGRSSGRGDPGADRARRQGISRNGAGGGFGGTRCGGRAGLSRRRTMMPARIPVGMTVGARHGRMRAWRESGGLLVLIASLASAQAPTAADPGSVN